MKKTLRGAISAVAACAMLASGSAALAVANETASLDERITTVYSSQNGNGMLFEKVSHPETGLQAADGVVDYIGGGAITEADEGQGDRGQSYSYAAESVGDWVYVGTMYGGLGVQAILQSGFAVNTGMTTDQAKALIQTMYAGHMYTGEPDGESAGGMLFKFNVKTGETKILMSKSAGIEGGQGVIPTFRSAFKMNGKLYFEGMVMDTANVDPTGEDASKLTQRELAMAIAMQNGFPCIYEVDPDNGDKLTRVYDSVDTAGFRELVAQNVFTSTRAIGSFGDTLIAGDLKPTDDGQGAAFLVASDTPSVPGSYKVIADMDSFDGLPAIHRSDVNGGGGIYQVQEFNGKLYVVVCTGSVETRDEETGTNRSFAIYVGENDGDPTEKSDWSWHPLAGDPELGARYYYGLDESRVSAGACTLQVYGDYLYIGDYNDVSSALQGFVLNSDFVTQATNLEQSINLYRMDADENVEMLVGEPNATFPEGGSTGLGAGFGNNMNQYTWQTTVHEGKMYLSTMNTTTLLEPAAQFTNGDILHMSRDEWKATVSYLRTFLALLFTSNGGGGLASIDADAAADAADGAAVQEQDAEALVDQAVEDANEALASGDVADIADGEVELVDEDRDELIEAVEDGSVVPGSIEDASTADAIEAINDKLTELETQIDDEASEEFLEGYSAVLADIEALCKLPDVPDSMKRLYDTIVKLTSKRNLQAYFKALPYLAQSKRGFNLFEITDTGDGVTVETVSDDGFGDPFNHGLRIFCDTDDYMLIGTANPFYGTQLWRVADTLFKVRVSATEGGSAWADAESDVAPGATVTLTAQPDDGYRFAGWNVSKGDIEIAEDGTFTMPGETVYVEAVFEPAGGSGSDSGDADVVDPAAAVTGDETDGAAAEADGAANAELASTGASVTALAVACALALAFGLVALSARRQCGRHRR